MKIETCEVVGVMEKQTDRNGNKGETHVHRPSVVKVTWVDAGCQLDKLVVDISYPSDHEVLQSAIDVCRRRGD
jgi:hypothetical protein